MIRERRRAGPLAPSSGRAPRLTAWLFTLAALGPVAWLLGFTWLVLRARAVTGRWPTPYQPDPASIGGVMANLLAGTLPLMYFTGLPVAVVLVIAVSVPSFRLAAREAGLRTWHVSVGLAAMALIALLLHANPWQLRVWLAD